MEGQTSVIFTEFSNMVILNGRREISKPLVKFFFFFTKYNPPFPGKSLYYVVLLFAEPKLVCLEKLEVRVWLHKLH